MREGRFKLYILLQNNYFSLWSDFNLERIFEF